MSHTDRSVSSEGNILGRAGILAFGVAAYLVGLVALIALVLATVGVPPFTGGLVRIGSPLAGALLDLGLLALFGVQHSVMARASFKERWTRIIPPAMERSAYLLATGAALLPLVLCWQPLPGVVWSVGSPAGRVALAGVAVMGWAYLLAATFAIDHLELFGLRQSWGGFRGRSPVPVAFRERWMYRFDRHPIMTGLLIGLWAVPEMTAGGLLLAGGLSAYVLVGVHFEERALMRALGEVYEDYRRRVPALVPTLAGRSGIVEVTTLIDAPAEQVWTHLADVTRWPDWLPTMTSVRPLGPVPLTIGGRYRIIQPKLPPAIWTVVDLAPGRSFAWESRSPGVRVLADHLLRPRPDGSTQVTLRIRFSGPLWALGRLLGGPIAREYVTREAALLKYRAESRG